ncbi:hypothetical protein D3C72_1488000 [compost metagenome]
MARHAPGFWQAVRAEGSQHPPLDAAQHLVRRLEPAHLLQPARRLGNEEADGQDEDRREGQHQEDVAPADALQEEIGEQPGGNESQGPEAVHQRDVTAATFGRDHFREQRLGDGELHAHADPEEDAVEGQGLHILRGGAEVAGDAPEDDAALEHRLAPEAVGQQP